MHDTEMLRLQESTHEIVRFTEPRFSVTRWVFGCDVHLSNFFSAFLDTLSTALVSDAVATGTVAKTVGVSCNLSVNVGGTSTFSLLS